MTPKERAAMQQALSLAKETLYCIVNADWRNWKELASPDEFERWVKSRANHALTALREALAEQAEQEPVAWRVLGEDGEPLSDWIDGKPGEDQDQWESTRGNTIQRAYTHHVRTKDLTDDEIRDAVSHPMTMMKLNDARAVIAKLKEKTNG